MIGDASLEALELLLRIMYAGIGRPSAVGEEPAAAPGVSIPREHALALFILADRYDMQVSVEMASCELVLLQRSPRGHASSRHMEQPCQQRNGTVATP